MHEWELSVANQTLRWIKSNYGLLWTHPKGIYFTAPVPGPLGTLHRQVTSPPEDLNGNNSRFGAALSFSVSKAMLSPELTLRWAPCQGRLLHGECRRSCEGLGARHQTQSLQDDRFPPTTMGKSESHSQELERMLWRGSHAVCCGPSPRRKGRQSCSQAHPQSWLRPAGKPGIP